MSRPANPPPELPCILKDTREQAPWCFSPAVTWEKATLPTADYSLKGYTDCVVVERKSIADLVMSCASKERERFWESCRRMKDYEHRVLIVEGAADTIWAHAYRSDASPRSVMATTLAMHVDFGVGVIWAGDVQQAAWTCEWFLSRVWKLKREKAKKEKCA